MDTSKDKIEALNKRMKELHIEEKDLIEKFILGSGPGGQKINKTASCVYLKHLPSGIEVKCQGSRSREENRFFARRLLIEKIEKNLFSIKTKKEQLAEKIRRQKRKRSKRSQEKMLKEKKERGSIKEMRKVTHD